MMRGQGRGALAHLAIVNHWSYSRADNYFSDALEVWEQRSRSPWRLNLDGLRQYGLVPPPVLPEPSGLPRDQ